MRACSPTRWSPRGYQLVAGGTDTHLMLVDLRYKGLTGKVAERALDAAGITVNKNTVPRETQSPFVTSGIRIGTPAVTTRGFRGARDAADRSMIDRVLMRRRRCERRADGARGSSPARCELPFVCRPGLNVTAPS